MNDLAVAIGIILLPGLVAAILTDRIVVHVRPWGSLHYGIYSFVFGVSSYFVLQVISFLQVLLPQCAHFLPLRLHVWRFIADSRTAVDYSEVFLATLLSPLIAITASGLVHFKTINRIAKRLGVTNKFGDENLYSFYLNTKELDWVYVRDPERGLTYQGKIGSFSESGTVQELVLLEVTVFSYENSEEYYAVPHLYLCRPRGSIVIEAVPDELLEQTDAEENVD